MLEKKVPDFTRIERALNSSYHCWSIYACPVNQTVENFLTRHSNELTKNSCPYINGVPAKLQDFLAVPCLLEVYQLKSPAPEVKFSDRYLVYDQSGIVVVFKPAGLHTYPAREDQSYSLKQFLEKRFAGEVHIPSRLDYSTAGLVLASYNASSHDYVQKLYQERWIEKTYLLATDQKPAWTTRRVDQALAADPRHPVLRQVVSNGGQTAVTDFKVLAEKDQRWLIEARPYTGRTHQIRVHAASIGIPICGDNFYNGTAAEQLCLISYMLSFPNPRDQSIVTVGVSESLRPDWLKNFNGIMSNAIKNKSNN